MSTGITNFLIGKPSQPERNIKLSVSLLPASGAIGCWLRTMLTVIYKFGPGSEPKIFWSADGGMGLLAVKF